MKKSERTVIKCTVCGFKYYKGDIHKCGGRGVDEIAEEKSEEKPKAKKIAVKSQKESFKMWGDSSDN